MKINSGVEQSIYSLLLLSRLPNNATLNSEALSVKMGVSHSYLKKVLKALVGENLIKSSPGKNGGFSLNKSLSSISLYDVFIAIEGRGDIFVDQNLNHGVFNSTKSKYSIKPILKMVENEWMDSLRKFTLEKIWATIEDNGDVSCIDQWILDMVNR